MDRRWVKGMAIACCVRGAIPCGIASLHGFFSDNTFAEIVPDSTLPVNSIVTPDGNASVITGGSVRGSNLFHSFNEFSVLTNGTAYFNNSADIQNILTRVTGRSVSNIDGLIKANGTANLFLINPNGIIFGPNASLNIGGSFLASTASGIKFADGTEFNARELQTKPLLTVSVPIGLQFGANPGSIVNQSIAINDSGTLVGLQVQPSQTLALIGGEVSLQGGHLTAPQGRIELGSVGDRSLVEFTPTQTRIALGYEGVQNFRDIQLSGQSVVNASGRGGGEIQVRGAQVTLTDGSAIVANTLGDRDGGGIVIQSDRFILQNGAFVSAATFGSGSGGDLTLQASESVQLTGNENFIERLISIFEGKFDKDNIRNGLFTVSFCSGASGDLTIKTGQFTVENGALVSSSTFIQGQGGALNLSATESVNISNAGLITGTAGPLAAGDLTISTQKLNVRNGGVVATATLGEGRGGNLSINASDSIEMFSENNLTLVQFKGLLTPIKLGLSAITSESYGGGDSGNLTIKTGRLILQRGAAILASNSGNKMAGDIKIIASSTVVLNDKFAGIVSQNAGAVSNSYGRAGNITIDTNELIVRNGAQIQAATFGPGSGGNLYIRALKSVELIGTSAETASGLLASSQKTGSENIGNAGDIKLETGRLILRDGARITVSGERLGNARNLEIVADSIHLDKGDIRALTQFGNFGNITLQVRDLQLRRNGSIPFLQMYA